MDPQATEGVCIEPNGLRFIAGMLHALCMCRREPDTQLKTQQFHGAAVYYKACSMYNHILCMDPEFPHALIVWLVTVIWKAGTHLNV